MRVRELIAELQAFDPELEVEVGTPSPRDSMPVTSFADSVVNWGGKAVVMGRWS